MKRILLLITTLLLITAVTAPRGIGYAAEVKTPTYSEISTFIDGKLLITASKSLLVNSSAYVPVKLLDQIPGISVEKGAVITVTGVSGSLTLDNNNSILYKGSSYVSFNKLLTIGGLDGKYASSATSLFIWTNDDGKAVSSSTLNSISKLPVKGNIGQSLGKKVYVYGTPGAHFITNVEYSGGSTIIFTLQDSNGKAWTVEQGTSNEMRFYTEEYLHKIEKNLLGLSVWTEKFLYPDTPLNNIEKVTIMSLTPNKKDSEFILTVKRASGEKVELSIPHSLQPNVTINDMFYFKDPRTVVKWSQKVWTAIEKGEVFTGMTSDQVVLSWGSATEVKNYKSGNVQYLQVIYPTAYLYFLDGKLVKIQKI